MTSHSEPKWHFAQGAFSDSWVAIYDTGDTIYYGYGRDQEEAMADAIFQIIQSSILEKTA